MDIKNCKIRMLMYAFRFNNKNQGGKKRREHKRPNVTSVVDNNN